MLQLMDLRCQTDKDWETQRAVYEQILSSVEGFPLIASAHA
jgi:hypothetical protein